MIKKNTLRFYGSHLEDNLDYHLEVFRDDIPAVLRDSLLVILRKYDCLKNTLIWFAEHEDMPLVVENSESQDEKIKFTYFEYAYIMLKACLENMTLTNHWENMELSNTHYTGYDEIPESERGENPYEGLSAESYIAYVMYHRARLENNEVDSFYYGIDQLIVRLNYVCSAIIDIATNTDFGRGGSQSYSEYAYDVLDQLESKCEGKLYSDVFFELESYLNFGYPIFRGNKGVTHLDYRIDREFASYEIV